MSKDSKKSTSYYTPKYLKSAKTSSEDLFWKSHNKSAKGFKEYVARYPTGRYIKQAYSKIGISKTIRWLLFGIALTIIIIAFFIGYKPVSTLSVNTELISFDKWGGTQELIVSTNVSPNMIDVDEIGDDFEFDTDNGYNYTVKANSNHGDERTAQVRICAFASVYGYRIGNYKHITVQLRQDSGLATILVVSSSKFDFGKFGGSEYFSIITDGMDTDIISDIDWATITKVKEGEYKVSVDVNPEGERHGLIIIETGQFHEEIALLQASGLATRFNVSPNNLTMVEEGTDDGQHYPITINTDGTTWSVTDKPSWLNTEVRLQSGILSITLDRNPGQIRTGTIRLLSNNGDLREIAVKQLGDPTNLQSSVGTVVFGTSSDYKNVSISNDSGKSLFTSISVGDERWLSANVSNNNQIRVTCTSNKDAPRSGTVNVICGRERTAINVKQDGWKDCSYCTRSGYTACSARGSWQNQLGYYFYDWHNGRHVIKRIYTDYRYDPFTMSYIPVPASSYTDCDICGGSGKIKCSHCKEGRIVVKSY